MERMKVYFIASEDLGRQVTLKPRVPDTAPHTEPLTPRICCALTVQNCLTSIEAAWNAWNKDSVDYWLYSALVDVSSIYQPSTEKVHDSWITGELWILEPTTFTLESRCIFRCMQDIPGTCYSRFSFRHVDEDEVVDRISSPSIYGDETSFAFIEVNIGKVRSILEQDQKDMTLSDAVATIQKCINRNKMEFTDAVATIQKGINNIAYPKFNLRVSKWYLSTFWCQDILSDNFIKGHKYHISIDTEWHANCDLKFKGKPIDQIYDRLYQRDIECTKDGVLCVCSILKVSRNIHIVVTELEG